MHQGGFAGTIMSDKAQALADADHEIDARQCADGAEGFFDAVKSDRFSTQGF